MCGLVGVYTRSSNGFSGKEQDVFNNLLFFDLLRGDDSTGVTAFFNNGEVSMLKGIGDAYAMQYYKEYGSVQYGEIMNDVFQRGKVVLGHNRKATIGQVSDESAHPFVIDDRFFFMHNGTLRNHKALVDGNTFAVDSEALGHHLCINADSKPDLEEALGKVEGAYATQWVDQEKQMLYLLRNRERPLYIAKTKEGYVWGSEQGLIIAACERNGQSIEKLEAVKPEVLYSLDLDGYNKEFKETELTVKKAWPLTTSTSKSSGGGTGSITAGTNTGNWVSKNGFKKMKGDLLGRTAFFFLDDYVDSIPGTPDYASGKWLVWGSNETMFKFNHKVCGYINDVDETAFYPQYQAVKLKGIVHAVEYEANVGQIVLHVKNVEIMENVAWH